DWRRATDIAFWKFRMTDAAANPSRATEFEACASAWKLWAEVLNAMAATAPGSRFAFQPAETQRNDPGQGRRQNDSRRHRGRSRHGIGSACRAAGDPGRHFSSRAGAQR